MVSTWTPYLFWIQLCCIWMKLLIDCSSIFCSNCEEDGKKKKKLNRNTYTLYIVNCVYCCLIPITRHRLNGVRCRQGVKKEEDKAYLKSHLLPGVLQSFLLGKFAFPSKSLHPWDVLEMKASSCQTCKIASQAGRAPGRGHPIHQTHWLLKGRGLRIVKMMNPNGWQHPGYRS